LGAEQHFDAEPAESGHDAARQLGAILRKNTLRRLDDGHFRAELAPSRTEFEPDVASADYNEPLRHFLERKRIRRRHNGTAERQSRQRHALGPGGDDHVLRCDLLRADITLDYASLA